MQSEYEMASVHDDRGEVLLERLRKRTTTTYHSFHLLVLELATRIQVGWDISGMDLLSFSSSSLSNINIPFRFISPSLHLPITSSFTTPYSPANRIPAPQPSTAPIKPRFIPCIPTGIALKD
jgi:hypothetical protein